MKVDVNDLASELTDAVYEIFCPLEGALPVSLSELLDLENCVTDELENIIEWKLQEMVDDGRITLGF